MYIETIQGVVIYTEGPTIIHNLLIYDTIWFVKEHVKQTSLRELINIEFKVAKHLLKQGYSILNPQKFDVELQTLFKDKRGIWHDRDN